MRQRRAVLRRVWGNRGIRRAELAFLGFSCAENGVWVSVLVYAYEQGGTGLAAAIAVIQLLPAAAVAPIASALTDRKGGAVGLLVGYVAQAISIAVTGALLLAGAQSILIYVTAVIASSAITFTRPAHAALLPTLVGNPGELTAANVVTGWFDTSSFLAGPAVAGVLIGIDGPGLSLAVFAGVVSLSALLVARPAAGGLSAPSTTSEPERDSSGAAAVLHALRSERGTTTLLGSIALQYVGLGAIDVLVVVLAIKLLALGPSGAGYLNAAFGAGGVLGGFAAIALIGRRRLSPAFAVSGLVWGTAFLVLGAWPTDVGALSLLATAGASRTVLDVSGRTLLQRVVPSQVRGRVFGVLEGFTMLGFAIGSAAVPLFALAGGPRASVAGIGVVLVLAAGSTVGVLARIELRAPTIETELGLLRASAIFGVLGSAELEELARSLTLVRARPGEVIVREQEPGDRYYIVADGTLTVSLRGNTVRELHPGDGFGEIALLRQGVRTATVIANEPATLYALDRSAFLDATTGSHEVRHAAEHIVAQHEGHDSSAYSTASGSGA